MQNKILKKKRGPEKKPGFRQELRITPVVEKVFTLLKEEHNLKNNSEALNQIAQIYMESFTQQQNI